MLHKDISLGLTEGTAISNHVQYVCLVVLKGILGAFFPFCFLISRPTSVTKKNI